MFFKSSGLSNLCYTFLYISYLVILTSCQCSTSKGVLKSQFNLEYGLESMNQSLVVLPFIDNDLLDGDELFLDGAHLDLISTLSKIPGLRVIAYNSSNRLKKMDLSLRETGDLLRVTHMLQVNVSHHDGFVTFRIVLIESESGSHELVKDYVIQELTPSSIYETQRDMAFGIMDYFEIEKEGNSFFSSRSSYPADLEVYRAFLRALQLNEVRNEKSLIQAKNLLEFVIDREPKFALAYVHLGSTYSLMGSYAGLPWSTAQSKAWETLNKGIKINDQLAEAYALKGVLISNREGDLDACRIAYERAIEINPNYVSAYHWYSNTMRSMTHDFTGANEYLLQALALDPLSPVLIFNYILYLGEMGIVQPAIDLTKKGISIESGYPYFWYDLRLNFTYDGLLDSAAYYVYHGMEINEGNGLFFSYYMETLDNLRMYDTMNSELQNFELSNRSDSLISMRWKSQLEYYNRDFEKVNEINDIIKSLDPSRTFSVDHQFNYLAGNFEKVVELYEYQYEDLLKSSHLSPYRVSQLNTFQEYVYSLTKIGHHEKAEGLWKKFGYLLFPGPKDKDEFKRNKKRRILFEIRQDIMEYNYEVALDKLEDYFNANYFEHVEELELDPIFDPLKSNPRFIKIMNDVKIKIQNLEASYLRFLNNVDQTNELELNWNLF